MAQIKEQIEGMEKQLAETAKAYEPPPAPKTATVVDGVVKPIPMDREKSR